MASKLSADSTIRQVMAFASHATALLLRVRQLEDPEMKQFALLHLDGVRHGLSLETVAQPLGHPGQCDGCGEASDALVVEPGTQTANCPVCHACFGKEAAGAR